MWNQIPDGGDLKAGDILKITGDDQQYVLTEDVTLGGAKPRQRSALPGTKKTPWRTRLVTVVLPSGREGERRTSASRSIATPSRLLWLL